MINRTITQVAVIIIRGRFTRPRQLSKAADNRIARRILYVNGGDVKAARKLVRFIRTTHWWLTNSEVFAKALRIRRRWPRRCGPKIPPFDNPPDGGNRRWRGRP